MALIQCNVDANYNIKTRMKNMKKLYLIILILIFIFTSGCNNTSNTNAAAQSATAQGSIAPTDNVVKPTLPPKSTKKAESKVNPYDAVSVVDISINPQVRLFLDADGIVLHYECMNEDAKEAFADLELTGSSFETASVQICEAAVEANLGVEDGKMEITFSQVFYNDEVGVVEEAPAFIKTATESVQQVLKEESIEATVVESATFVLEYDDNFVPVKEYVELADGKVEEKVYEEGALQEVKEYSASEVVEYYENVTTSASEYSETAVSTLEASAEATTEKKSAEVKTTEATFTTKETTKESAKETTKETTKATTKETTKSTTKETTKAAETTKKIIEFPYKEYISSDLYIVLEVDFTNKIVIRTSYNKDVVNQVSKYWYNADFSAEDIVNKFSNGDTPYAVYKTEDKRYDNGNLTWESYSSSTINSHGGTTDETSRKDYVTGTNYYRYEYRLANGATLEIIHDETNESLHVINDENNNLIYYEKTSRNGAYGSTTIIYEQKGDWLTYSYTDIGGTTNEKSVNTQTKEAKYKVISPDDLVSPEVHAINAVYNTYWGGFNFTGYEIDYIAFRYNVDNGVYSQECYYNNGVIYEMVETQPNGSVKRTTQFDNPNSFNYGISF